MEGYLRIVLVSMLLMSSMPAIGQKTTINPHNFSNKTWGYSERCSPCHVDNPENNTGKAFLISYESDSISSADSTSLSGISKLCFACHDGTVAGFTHSADFEQRLGSDGSTRNHPVSVNYTSDHLRKTKLYDPDIALSGLGGTISEDMLVNGRIECTSCHDAHFSMVKTSCKSCPPGKNDRISSLWVENKKSALCLICHKL